MKSVLTLWGGLIVLWLIISLVNSTGPAVLRQGDGTDVMMPYPGKLNANIEKAVFWMTTAPLCILFIQELYEMPGRAQKIVGHVAGGALYIATSTLIHIGWSSIPFPRAIRIIARDMGTHAPATLAYFKMFLAEGCLAYGLAFAAVTLARSYAMQRAREREAAAVTLHASHVEAQLMATRLATLRSQLQPHFLFNTLNGISALTEAQPSQARGMLAQLSALLRRAIETEHDEVPLGQELEWVESYIDLQQTRFNDRINVELRIDPDAVSAYVPHLILQPLVENALEHGFASAPSSHELIVEANRLGDTLHLLVTDNGNGCAQHSHASGSHSGIGLSNTRERLSALFGSYATLALSPGERGGTIATIVIPFLTSPRSYAARQAPDGVKALQA